MNCPHCHEDLISKDYENISVHTCKDCGGIWLSPIQLSNIITLREQFSPEEIQNTLKISHPGILPAETESTALPCPVCSQGMEEINYDYSSGVIVHSCTNGDGLWFDKNELEEVQIFMEHWDDEENSHKQELLDKMKQSRQELKADEDKAVKEVSDNMSALSRTSILQRVFNVFHNLKDDK